VTLKKNFFSDQFSIPEPKLLPKNAKKAKKLKLSFA
jgi:hypothetical protein